MKISDGMRREGATLLCVVVGTCLLAVPVFAQEEPRPAITRQAFKLDPPTGCFDYTGTAVEFNGRFRAGSYVRVAMATLDTAGQPVPSADDSRVPFMNAPEFKTTDSALWFGPLPESGTYSIGFVPSSAHGSSGHVVICGRTSPPRQDVKSQ